MVVTLHIDEQRGWRGGEQQASYLIRGLAARGQTVIVAGRPRSRFLAEHRDVPGVVCLEAPFVGEADAVTAWRVSRAVRQYRVDIIHAHTSHGHSAACWARMLANRGKVVVSRRVDFAPSSSVLARWKYARPDLYLAISQRVAGVLHEHGVDAGRIRVVYSSQDPERLVGPPADRAALGLEDLREDDPLLLCPAALVGHKDHATLIAAMPAVIAVCPRVRLILAGEGPLRGEIEGQIRSLGIERHVRLLGQRDDVPALMRAADLFVLSSQMEGLGSAILEAMLIGLPVVACAAGGIPEVVLDGETGLLALPGRPDELARQVARALREPGLAQALAERAYTFAAQRFTADRMVDATLAAYEDLLRESAG